MDVCVTKNPGTYMLSDKMVATAVEAVMGAVYLDGGEMALELVMNESGFDVHQFLWGGTSLSELLIDLSVLV
jgi:ribonuclease-3